MRSELMRRLAAVTGFVLLAGLCWAPIGDKPEGAQFHGELSEQEMSRWQGTSKAGPVTEKSRNLLEDNDRKPLSGPPDKTAAQVIAGTAGQSPADLTRARESLQRAVADGAQEEKRPATFYVFLAGIFLVLGLGASYGVRRYLNHVVPDAPQKQ